MPGPDWTGVMSLFARWATSAALLGRERAASRGKPPQPHSSGERSGGELAGRCCSAARRGKLARAPPPGDTALQVQRRRRSPRAASLGMCAAQPPRTCPKPS